MAAVTGIIINDETNNAPNILSPNTINVDIHINNIFSYISIFIPIALQKSLSNTNANNLLYIRIDIAIMAVHNIAVIYMSCDDIASMLPKRYEFISTLKPVLIDISIMAIAIDTDDIIAIAVSAYTLSFFTIYLIHKLASITIGTDNIIGDLFNINANAIEKKLTCDRPSPIILYFFKITKILSKENADAINIPDKIALCINKYDNISYIFSIYASSLHVLHVIYSFVVP